MRFIILISIAILVVATDGRSNNFDLSGFAEVDKRLMISDEVSNGDTFGKLRIEGRLLCKRLYPYGCMAAFCRTCPAAQRGNRIFL